MRKRMSDDDDDDDDGDDDDNNTLYMHACTWRFKVNLYNNYYEMNFFVCGGQRHAWSALDWLSYMKIKIYLTEYNSSRVLSFHVTMTTFRSWDLLPVVCVGIF